MKSAKEYVKDYRNRKRSQGFVKREIWIPSEYSIILKTLEAALQNNIIPIIPTKGENRKMWDTSNLYTELSKVADEHGFIVNPIDGSNALQVVDGNLPEFPVVVVVNGDVILASVTLLQVNEVPSNEGEFNRTLLQLNPQVPLSAFGIVGNSYVLYGELSSESSLANILVELRVLNQNVVNALEVISELLD